MAMLLYWNKEDASERIRLLAPFYYSSQTEEEKVRVLFPFHVNYQTVQESFTLLGPYWSKKSPGVQTRFLFPFYFNQVDPHGRTTFLTLYYRAQNKDRDLQTVFPLYWSLKSLNPNFSSYQALLPFYVRIYDSKKDNWYSPFYLRSKLADSDQGLALPFYWDLNPEQRIKVGFPLYWHFWKKGDENQFKEYKIIVPWFEINSGESHFRSFFPIYWGRTKTEYEDKSSTGAVVSSDWNLLFPLAMSHSRPDGSFSLITPLFSRFKDVNGKKWGHSGLNVFVQEPWGGKTEGFLPFFIYRQEPDSYQFRSLFLWLNRDAQHEHELTAVFPLLGYKRDADRWQWAGPGFYWDQDPDRVRGYFLNYFFSKETDPDSPGRPLLAQKRIFFPLYWQVWSQERAASIIFPLFAHYRKAELEWTFAVPFYFKRRKGDDVLAIIPPVIYRRSPEKQWTGFLFFFVQESLNQGRSFALLPLYRRSQFPNGSSLYLPGFYYLREGRETQGVLGPYFWDHRGKTQYELFPPIYWMVRRPAWQFRTLIPYYHLRLGSWEEKGVFPIWARSHETGTSTDTFHHYLADSHRVLPFYLYRKERDETDLWLPIIAGRLQKGVDKENRAWKRGRLFLFNYWERTDHYYLNRLDPLYAYLNSDKSKGFRVPTAPFPLWQHEVDGLDTEGERVERGAVFPYYWKNSNPFVRRVFLPVYYHNKIRDSSGDRLRRTTTIFLNYIEHKNLEEEKSLQFWVPLYWRAQNKLNQHTVFPLVWLQKGESMHREVVFPVWWHLQRGNDSSALLFPLFFQSKNDEEHQKTLLIPGFWSKRDNEGSLTLAGPFYRRSSRDGSEKTTLLFPLYWSAQTRYKSARTLFPFYWHWRENDRQMQYLFPLYFRHEREKLKWNILFPVYWSLKTAEDQIRIIPPYFSVESANARSKTVGLAPFWIYSSNLDQGYSQFQFLGGLFGVLKEGEKKTVTLLWFINLKGGN